MEEPRLMDLARVVPATLLHVGTSEKAITIIKGARELFSGDQWSFDDSDDPESPPSCSARGGGCSVGLPADPADTTGGCDHGVGGAPSMTACVGEAGVGCEVPANEDGSNGAAMVQDATGPGDNCWADLVASALAPEGHLPAAYREITRLVSLHAEAGHVFVLCAAHLVLQQDDGGDARAGGLRPDNDAPWERWLNLRQAAVRHAHDALLRLSSAASAAAAAEDFLRWRWSESPRRAGWGSAVRQLVQEARRSLGEAKDAVRLMRHAVLCEFFETWTILRRA